MTNQRINAVGAHANIQHANSRAGRDDFFVAGGQQVGCMVNVISPARNRWAKVAGGNLPAAHAVVQGEQGAIQSLDCTGVGKINAGRAAGGGHDIFDQARRDGGQGRKVISSQAFVTGVESRFWGRGRHLISDHGRGGGVSHELIVAAASQLPTIYPGPDTQERLHSRKITHRFGAGDAALS